MGINFPNTPLVGDIYPVTPVAGQPQYVWDGEKWGSGNPAAYVGAVRYDTPQALTSAQASQARSNIAVTKKNYIINGGMQISQEWGSTLLNAASYPVDMFAATWSHGGALNHQQVAVVTPGGSPNRIRFTVTTADAAVAAGDYFIVYQGIEGLRVADLRSGSVAAKTITIQFGVKAPAGTYCVGIRNSGNTRSYAAEYVIAAGEANADTVKSVTLPLDTTGAWATDSTVGLSVHWTLMAGTTFQTSANAWAGVNAFGTANQFNFMGTNGNIFELFDVSLTEGTVAPPFMVPDYASELALCKRYWEQIGAVWSGQAIATAVYFTNSCFVVEKRTAPTITSSQLNLGNAGFSARTLTGVTSRSAVWQGACSVTTNGAGFNDTLFANARL